MKETSTIKSLNNPRGHAKNVRVKTAKRRKNSSTRWLERQLNDPYVAEARRRGFRSRAIFKLMQLDEKLSLLKQGMSVVDLGAAPGGWTEYIVSKVKPENTGAKVVAIDYLDMRPVDGAIFLKKDFTDIDAADLLKKELCGRGVDLVVSDMAAPTTGHKQTDHIRIIDLSERGYAFARDILSVEGAFLTKVFHGGATDELLRLLKLEFKSVKHIKPSASRQDSAEVYVVATGFKGKAKNHPWNVQMDNEPAILTRDDNPWSESAYNNENEG